MTTTVLPTANKDSGVYGTSIHAGWDGEEIWTVLSLWLIEGEGKTPGLTRKLLDSRFGRRLVDDLSFMNVGRTHEEKIAEAV